MERVLSFLKDAGVFFYATVDGDKPRLRPFGLFLELNGKFYFGMGQQKESYKQTIANPNVEICALNKQNQWIRIRGIAVEDKTPETCEKVFAASPFLKNLYNEQTGNKLGIFWLKDGYAEIADMAGNFEKFNF